MKLFLSAIAVSMCLTCMANDKITVLAHGPLETKYDKKAYQERVLMVNTVHEDLMQGADCTATAWCISADGSSSPIIVTEHAGWFLSNTEAAQERACDKAAAQLAFVLSNSGCL